MATDLEELAERVIEMHLDDFPRHDYGDPDMDEWDDEYWQAVEALARHPRYDEIMMDLPFEVRVDCEGAM